MDRNPLYKGEGIKEIIPQRAPIMMVDTFYDATSAEGFTGLTVSEENIFCKDGLFTEPGVIEHIAQSASAFAGYNAKANNLPTPIGFIGEVKKFKIAKLPKVNDTLKTNIKIISEVMNVSLLTAETKVNGELVASCQMKIFIKE
jgi:3-hydroxymyristoyl/3-hydroxydecanoyl-(acyl carrier protein) dehydratase